MWYRREVVGVGEVNDSGADLDIFRLLAVPFDRLRTGYVCLLPPSHKAMADKC